MEAVLCFKEKIASNWQAYHEKLLALPKEDLIDRAEEIAAVKLSREVLTTSCISQDELDYLERFENPLEVVSDAWLDAQNVDTGGEFNHVLWALRDRQDAEQLYEMEQTMLNSSGWRTGSCDNRWNIPPTPPRFFCRFPNWIFGHGRGIVWAGGESGEIIFRKAL